MFDISACQLDDIAALISEPMNIEASGWIESGHADILLKYTEAFKVSVNNELMLVGGVTPMWLGRGILWTVFSEKVKYHSPAVYRGARKYMHVQPYNRIEMDVPCDLELAHRRAVFLGFKLEVARARKFSPRGEDRSLYAWVRE